MEEKRFCSDLNEASLVAAALKKLHSDVFWLQLLNTAAMSKHSQGKEVGQCGDRASQPSDRGFESSLAFFVTVQHS